MTSWDTGGSFSDSTFAGTSGAVASWPLDDTTTTQSYSRVVNPAVSTGRNIVLNGDFASDTLWTKGTGWTISGGVATSNNTGATGTVLYQNLPITNGKAYSITFTISNYVSGTARLYLGSGTAGSQRTANGTYTETLIASGGASYVGILPYGGNLVADIDNVSVTQINIPANTATPTQLLTDGDMEASGTSSWTVGNAATLSKVTASPHGGTNALRIARSSTNNPYAHQVATTLGDVYRFTGYARSDGTAIPSITNFTTTLWTGTSSTEWQPFDVVFVATYAGGNIAIQALTSSGTQYVEFDDVVVSLDTGIRAGELVQDGDMAFADSPSSWTSADANHSWKANNATLSKETVIQHGGSSGQALRILRTASTASAFQNVMRIGKTYRVAGWYKTDGVSSPQVTDFITTYFTGTAATSWTYFETTFIAQNVAMGVIVINGVNGVNFIDFDDISVTEIDPLVGKPTNGVTLGSTANGHLTNAYTFDGTNDVVNIYSSDLNSAFNPSEGTAVAWIKPSSSGVWTDATGRYVMYLAADVSNVIYLAKVTTNNTFQLYYSAGGTAKTVSTTTLGGSSSWTQVVLTWSKSNDQLKAYINGTQVGTTQTGLGTWVGNLLANNTTLGATNVNGANPWSGMINDVRLYSTALSDSQIAALYTSTARDTGTTYNSTTGSAKVISPTDETTTLTQSVNVGDTNTYNMVAYAYTTGVAVTSSDVSLYANGSTVSTTYTSVGSGWYKLTGTVTGVASSIGYGAIVSAGKTVYLDNFSLSNYYTPGTLTSSIFDSGFSSNWGTLTYSATTPTNTTASVKIRTSNDASMTGATDFASCTAISSGSDISSNSCVSDGHRYAQYLVTLATTNTSITPTFTSFSLAFSNSVAPTGGISVNSGAGYTGSTGVTLTLTASDDVDTGSTLQMETANTSDFAGTSYEAFASTKSWTLTSGDGTKTVYVRYKDTTGNVSSTYSDTIGLDTTAPTDISLSSPADNTITNNERPTFVWKATSDASSGLSSYLFQIHNSDGTGFTLSGLPTSGSSDIVTSKYTLHFDGDSLSLYTKSSADWGAFENDGKLAEGNSTWTVKAQDALGNETASSWNITLDRTAPSLIATLENRGTAGGYLISDTQSPKLIGTATDNFKLDRIEVSYYSQDILLGIITNETLYLTQTTQRDSTDTSTQTVWPVSLAPSKALEYGKYHVYAKVIDSVGNVSPIQEYFLSVLPQEKVQVIIPESVSTSGPGAGKLSIPELEKQAIVRSTKQAAELTKLTDQTASIFTQATHYVAQLFHNTSSFIVALFGNVSHFIASVFGQVQTFIASIGTQILAWRLPSINPPTITLPTIAIALPKISLPTISIQLPYIQLPSLAQISDSSRSLARTMTSPIAWVKSGYDRLLLASSQSLQYGSLWVGATLQRTGQQAWIAYENGRDRRIADAKSIWQGARVIEALNLTLLEIHKPVIATGNFFHKARVAYDTAVAIMFDNEPTRISNVTVEEIGPDYAIVSYKTNHRAWGKVNYGPTLSYGSEVQLPERDYIHRAKLTGLVAGEKYFFEVMAQNGNYAYDAYYVIEVPVKKEK